MKERREHVVCEDCNYQLKTKFYLRNYADQMYATDIIN